MDTGVDVGSADGNPLLRFTGDFLGGDLGYEVITDLATASAPDPDDLDDLDDMSPDINAMGESSDSPGYAIDASDVCDLDHLTGTGTQLGNDGTCGWIPHVNDSVARLYVFTDEAELFEANPTTLPLSPLLIQGPAAPNSVNDGWSGLAGPLTQCVTNFP